MATPIKNGGHWYSRAGEACHFVEKKNGGGTRPTTLADARKAGWLPSSTSILKILDKPALTRWLQVTAIEAALTTPRKDGEGLDEFANRVLEIDAESIGQAARDLGMEIHDGIESCLNGGTCSPELLPYITPVLAEVAKLGKPVAIEKIVVAESYAGKLDLMVESEETLTVIDFKTTKAKKLPKESYIEHRLQLASYAATFGNTGSKRIVTRNIYISTERPGELSVTEPDTEWQDAAKIFNKLVDIWQFINSYNPNPTPSATM